MGNNYIEEEDLKTTLQDLKSRMKWKDIVKLVDFQGIAIGTLSNILNGRIPHDPVLREKLHLPPHPECGHCWRFNTYIREAVEDTRPRQRIIKRWRDMPVEIVALALEHREVIYDNLENG